MDRVVDVAQAAYDTGDFRWAATLLDHAVFAEESHAGARELYADTLEQLAYGAENGTWRNFFLSGETELREGNFGTPAATAAPAVVAQMTVEQIFDAIAISVNGPRAWGLVLAINFSFTDLNSAYRATLSNGVFIARQQTADDTAGATLTLTKARLIALALTGDIASPGIEVEGDAGILQTLLGALDKPDPSFAIVTP